MDPSKHLAAAVLLQAVDDAGRATADGDAAREWLMRDDCGFSFWCAVLGIDPTKTRETLKCRLENGHKRRIDKAAIVAFVSHNPAMSNREIGRRLNINYETVRKVRRELIMP